MKAINFVWPCSIFIVHCSSLMLYAIVNVHLLVLGIIQKLQMIFNKAKNDKLPKIPVINHCIEIKVPLQKCTLY